MKVEAWTAAGRDLWSGASRTWLWWSLARNDIRHRYSGSLLGSLWITANIALLAACLTFVFSGPLRANHADYAPYVTIGLVFWYFVQAALAEAPNVFVTAGDTIRQSPLPVTIHVLRMVARNAIVLGHNAIIIPIVLIAFARAPSAWALGGLLALPLLAANVAAAGFILGLLGARFRDVQQIVASGLQVLFFATPIVWFPGTLAPGREWIASANPIFAFIDVLRAPLLGGAPAPASWPTVLGTTLVSAIAAALAFARYRNQIVYWV